MKTGIRAQADSSVDARRRRLVLALPLLGALPYMSAVAAPHAAGDAGLSMARKSLALMGTRVDVVVPDSKASELPELLQCIDAAFMRMQQLERLMSRYREDSDVARMAAAAGVKPVRVAPEVLEVLLQAQRLHAQSGGALDITIGAVNKGWSFEPGREQVPSDADVKRALALVNMRQLVVDPKMGTAFLQRPGMALDLGGIAKLPILQAGLQTLQDKGIANALINGGGDVLIAGSNHGKPWRVGVRDPNAPQQLLGAMELQGRGVVASSGDYERSFVRNGRHLHHVLDPRTGWPTQGVHGVALRADRIEDVNGWGAALMVRGNAALAEFSARNAGIDVMAGLSDGSHWLSAGMELRLQRVPAA
ncbi:FAD:protein FMN transferase [Diaphorobacter sp. HDW4B]|uniref:FAD:protein FMN transferase n=1 Tax=Diaphorobacter sp. HDW4B TaxID=2714925 RepID=UPI0014084825|nr:FAD:protein FMN transferase [Diaphorobacter sp. HDW4B]QIL69728.1 FAD:protein FMN transferase [Diaphorobacter sp. HDW4B]